MKQSKLAGHLDQSVFLCSVGVKGTWLWIVTSRSEILPTSVSNVPQKGKVCSAAPECMKHTRPALLGPIFIANRSSWTGVFLLSPPRTSHQSWPSPLRTSMPAGMQESLWLVSRLPTVTAKTIFQLSLPPGKEPRATKALIHQLSPSSDPLEQTHWARKIALTAPRSACLMTEDLPLAPSRVTVHCFLHGHCSSHTINSEESGGKGMQGQAWERYHRRKDVPKG